MLVQPEFYTDGHILCRKVARAGKAPVIDMYNDRRAGVTFPSANNQGYFCIFGLKSVVTHKDRLPLELLAEGKFDEQKKLFMTLIKNMQLMSCNAVYGDCSKANESSEMEFGRVVKRLNAVDVSLFDASDFDGFDGSYANFDAARAPLDEYGRQGMIIVPGAFKVWGEPDKGRWPGDSLLKQDLAKAGTDTVRSVKPWETYPAANAFNHVVMSYVISPWQKPGKNSGLYGEWEGYGG